MFAMNDRAWNIHMARVYLAQAAHTRKFPQHSWWHAKLLEWAAKYRLKAAACTPQQTQIDLFGDPL